MTGPPATVLQHDVESQLLPKLSRALRELSEAQHLANQLRQRKHEIGEQAAAVRIPDRGDLADAYAAIEEALK
jgi:hypothetical protein